jgi:pyruvate,orthophosphate dikinase
MKRFTEGETMELEVLRTLQLKGRAGVDDIAAATGKAVDELARFLDALVETGQAREIGGGFAVLPPARARLTELLDAERARVDRGAVEALYDKFTAVNGDFKQLASDWQLKDGQPNDHADRAYDQSVLDRLPGIHARVMPTVEQLGSLVPRLAPYGTRLQRALERVQSGNHAWLLKPLIDSYHTIWFELHEELIGLAGLTREAEATAGRAE